MGQNQVIESLVELMLSWMRWLTSWFWNIVNAGGTSSGFLGWFSKHWVGLAITLIVLGALTDWLIWMIRWRPYWLWLRKRQIVYEEVVTHQRPKRKKAKPARTTRPQAPVSAPDFDDPFAAQGEEDPYAAAASMQDADVANWDITEDPYAHNSDVHTDYDPRVYARPTLGEQANHSTQSRRRPILGERKRPTHVDNR